MHCDIDAEKTVLACLIQGKEEAYLDIVDVLHEPTIFTSNDYCVIFSCIKYCYDVLELDSVDFTTVLSAASSLKLIGIFDDKVKNKLRGLESLACNVANIRHFSLKLRRIYALNVIERELLIVQEKVKDFSGDERLSEIMGTVESHIFGLPEKFGNTDDEVVRITNTLDEYIKEKIEDPVSSLGVSTGFPYYDQAIGDGLVPGDLHIICASAKNYKTGFVMNCANHMAKNGVKVLIMDSELRLEQQQSRLLAMESGIETKEIRRGTFVESKEHLDKVINASKILQDKHVDFVSIAGKPFDEHMAILRRWYHKNIKGGDPCVFIYDYLKVPSSSDSTASQYDMLGTMTSALKDFGTKHEISALALAQQNREGGKTLRDDEFTTGDSFKIVQYCSSLSIFRKKTAEEIANDGAQNGNQLLKPAVARDGAGSDYGYINYYVDGSCMKIKELGPRSGKVVQEGFEETDNRYANIEF